MPKLLSRDFIEGPAFAVLNEFLGLFRSDDGIARPNRYEIILYAPSTNVTAGKSSLSDVYSQILTEKKGEGIDRRTSLRCQSISFPGRNLDTTPDTNIYGPTRDIVTGFSYGEINGTFLCSSDLREKEFFELWQSHAFNPETWALKYYDDYVGGMDIYQLDEKDVRRYGIKLFEVFPKTISAQGLSYGTNNTATTVDVGFSFRHWKNLKNDPSIGQGRDITDKLYEIAINTVERKIQSQIPKVLSRL